jgi:hypothetical protein
MANALIAFTALAMFLLFTFAPSIRAVLAPDGSAPVSPLAVIGDDNGCTCWATYLPSTDNEQAAIVATVRSDRRDDGTGSEVRPS